KLSDEKTGGALFLYSGEEHVDRFYFGRDRSNKYFTIAWNRGPKQTVTIDGTAYDFPANNVLTLLFDQTFQFESSAAVVAWQFNREFYCLIDHDSEVSCVGFLFGATDHLFIQPGPEEERKLNLLFDMFAEEFRHTDMIQHEMLLVL